MPTIWPCYGTWVTHTGDVIRTPANFLDKYMADGPVLVDPEDEDEDEEDAEDENEDECEDDDYIDMSESDLFKFPSESSRNEDESE